MDESAMSGVVAAPHPGPASSNSKGKLMRNSLMKVDLEKLEVVRNEAENRFEAWVEGQLCKLDYFLDGKAFVIAHVGVPLEFRGQGVAGKIVQASLEYARERSLRVIPMCSYAAIYIRKHPQYMDLMKPGEGA